MQKHSQSLTCTSLFLSRQRAEEMEEELEKTKQSYQTQMSAHEKKAHNNWVSKNSTSNHLKNSYIQ